MIDASADLSAWEQANVEIVEDVTETAAEDDEEEEEEDIEEHH